MQASGMHGCVALFFGGGGVAADMELAEEARIVWIRDFTLRGLPMCNSFWRP